MIIDIFCGACWEPFTPKSLEGSGIGGSETAVIHMAKQLGRLGASVTVWGEAFENHGNVKYRHYKEWRADRGVDVLISWRNVVPFTQKDLKARHRVLWLHDLGLPTLPYGIVNEIDAVAVLSEFHGRALLQNNPRLKGKLWYVGNGIDPQWYTSAPAPVKNPFWFVYSSSPRRGLAKLLNEWPEVRAEFPEVVLHVAYGFDLTLKMEAQNGNHYEVRAYERMLRKCQETDGVIYHGRLSHDKLANIQRQCTAWLYPPSDFEETFCITALEVQAAKAWPITRNNGALPEVVQYHQKWKSNVSTIEALYKFYDKPPTEEEITANYQWAMQHTWAVQAENWKSEFEVRLEA